MAVLTTDQQNDITNLFEGFRVSSMETLNLFLTWLFEGGNAQNIGDTTFFVGAGDTADPPTVPLYMIFDNPNSLIQFAGDVKLLNDLLVTGQITGKIQIPTGAITAGFTQQNSGKLGKLIFNDSNTDATVLAGGSLLQLLGPIIEESGEDWGARFAYTFNGYKLRAILPSTGPNAGKNWVTVNHSGASENHFGVGTSTPTEAIEVVGNVKASGFKTGAATGVSGTFTTADAKTVTVTNGIITSIV